MWLIVIVAGVGEDGGTIHGQGVDLVHIGHALGVTLVHVGDGTEVVTISHAHHFQIGRGTKEIE